MMSWLRKLFGCTDHKNSAEGPSNFMDSSNQEDEDLNIAKALSLSEQEQEKGKAVDDNSHLEEDEQLARALQESFNTSLQNRETFKPVTAMLPLDFRKCACCNKEITSTYFNKEDLFWHKDCLFCHDCRKPISNHEFSMYGKKPYHQLCFRNLNVPKCYICEQFVPINQNGIIECLFHPFWEKKYCHSHNVDGTPQCCSCERKEPRDASYITLDDGRKLCLECLPFAIMDDTEFMNLCIDIQEFYEGLIMKVKQQFPLLLVERQALNEAREGEKEEHHNFAETRGLCLSEEQIIRRIVKRPVVGPEKKIRNITTQPYKLVRKCEVTAILVLYGLPRLLTGSILAHEMMHAWLRLNGYRGLSLEVEEGICQELAYMWLDSEIISGSGTEQSSVSASSSSSISASAPSSTKRKGAKSQEEKKFGEFCKFKIESDKSAYGIGFRAAHRAVEEYSLKRVLDHIKITKSFP